ncbi:MAG: DNA methylase, partial [Bacteroidaceae bacterium]|nr:DNA methylase [Bacteroidaceae bacterium]
IVDRRLLVRRLNLSMNHVVDEQSVAQKVVQLDLFDDHEARERRQERERAELKRERTLQETVLKIKKRFGKNAVLKGLNFGEGATAQERNRQIGGHRA